eukprot:1295826-Amphidinium_carterae.1
MIEKIKEEIRTMSNQADGQLRFPAGTRPFKAPTDVSEMDEPIDMSWLTDFEIRVPLNPRAPARQNMEKVYHCMQLALKRMHGEVLVRHQVGLKPITSRAHFTETCKQVVDKYRTDAAETGGMDQPKKPAIPDKLIYMKVEKLYGAVVDAVVKDKKKKDEEMEKKRKAREDELKELANRDPEKILESIIEKKVDLKMQSAKRSTPQSTVEGRQRSRSRERASQQAVACEDKNTHDLANALASKTLESKNEMSP